MTLDIKERIVKLNNGELPNGYKKTEFGVFPCDWVTDNRLGDLGIFDKGQGLPGYKSFSEGLPCVRYGDIYTLYNNFHFEKAQNHVDDETAAESLPVGHGTLLFAGTGETAEEIGKCVCYNGYDTIYVGGDIITFQSDEVNPLFLAYQQYQEFSLNQKSRWGQGHSVVHIQKSNLEKMHVAYPKSTTEQAKIAEILMQWDKAIELQKQYIKKLESRKILLMRKLLTPQENWEYVLLGENCKIRTGHLDANAMVADGEYPFFTCAKEIYRIDKFSFDCEALLIAGNGDIGDIKYYNGKFDAYQRTYVLSNFTFDIKYIMYYLLLNFNRDIMKGMQKSSMPYIKLDLLKNARVYFEKTMINKTVSILSKVDEEIQLQQKRKSVLNLQRKALQQYLLTGIVRVETN